MLESTTGRLLTTDVELSDPTDLASFGLDEQGVLAKHKRLTPQQLRSALETAFAATDREAAQLYEAVARMIVLASQGKPHDNIL